MIPQRFPLLLTVLALAVAAPASASITLTPGDLLISSLDGQEILKYSPAGVKLESVTLLNGNVDGMAVVNGEVYISSDGQLGKVNVSTGGTTWISNLPSAVGGALGTVGGNLLFFNHGISSIHEFTTAGVLVKTIDMTTQLGTWNGLNYFVSGLDTYDNQLFITENSGNLDILKFDLSGAPTGVITRTGQFIVSSAFDDVDGSFWTMVGATLSRLDGNGNVIQSFTGQAADGFPVFGGIVEVINVPEPGAPALLLLLAGSTVFRRRRA